MSLRITTLSTVVLVAALGLVGCASNDKPAGAPTQSGALAQDDKSTAEIVRWVALPSVTDDQGQVQLAKTGTKFVNVEVQFRGVTEQTKCTIALVASDGKPILADPKAPKLGDVTSCQGAGADPLVSTTFIVPSDQVEGLKGITLDPSGDGLTLPRP